MRQMDNNEIDMVESNIDKNKIISIIVKTIVFLSITALILSYVLNALKFKYGDGIFVLDMFYKQEPDTVDVLVLGSSHAFEDINPAVLFTEYGIASYDLCGSVQPLWNTYYYLEEALKTQSPKLVILEAYCINFNEEFSDDSRIIKNNFGLNLSSTKINSLKASAPENRFEEFFIEPYQYHTRYSVLNKEDFQPHLGSKIYENWKGFGCNLATTIFDTPNVLDVSALSWGVTT